MSDAKHKLYILKIFIPLLTVVALGSLCANPNPSIIFDPMDFKVLSINTYYEEAQSIALEWDTNAYPSYIFATFATFAMPDDITDNLAISYGYGSHTNPAKWLMIMINTMNPSDPKITNGLRKGFSVN